MSYISDGEVKTRTGESLLYLHFGVPAKILFLHGFLTDGRIFSSSVDISLSQGIRSVVLNLPGHGGSQYYEDNNFSLERSAEDIVSCMEQMVEQKILISNPSIIAFSFGAYYPQIIATKHPGRIRSFVAINGHSTDPYEHRYGSSGNRKARVQRFILKKLREGSKEYEQGTLVHWGSIFSDEIIQKAGFFQTLPGCLGAYQQAIFDAPAYFNALFSENQPPTDIPSLFITSKEDRIVLPEYTEAAAERFGGRFVEIEGTHFTPIQQSKRLTEIIIENAEYLKLKK